MTQLYVLAGTGGVGKTTLSAAMGRALSPHQRVLVVTVDPARRLADALGAPESTDVVRLPGLSIWMPQVDSALDLLVDTLMPASTAQLFKNNFVTAALRSAPAGMHEVVVALTLAGFADRYDAIVLDTAPSQQGLDFLDTPRRLERILHQRSLDWLSSFGSTKASRGLRFVERAVTRVIPIDVLAEAARFFTALISVRSELAERATIAQRLLDEAHYFVVAAPTQAAVEGALHLRTVLRMRRTPVTATILNRVPSRRIDEELRSAPDGASPALRDALDALRDEHATAVRAAMLHATNLGECWTIEERFGSAQAIVESLAASWSEQTGVSQTISLSA